MISSTLATKVLGVQSKEELNKILQENPQIADKYDEALRKYLKVITYFHYKKQQLPGAIARAHLLQTDPTFATLPEDDQHDKIDELVEDQTFVKTNITPVLETYLHAPLLSKEGKQGAIQLLQSYNLLNGSIIPADQKKIAAIQEDCDELIKKDEGEDVFTELQEALQANNYKPSDIDMLIPHQANLRIIQFIQHSLKLADDKVYNNIQYYGNTTAASVPIALCEAWEKGKIKTGDLVCLTAFGSGFTWASALIKW